jgi:hypothetical protein
MRTNFLGLVLFMTAALGAFAGQMFEADAALLVTEYFWVLCMVFGAIFMADGMLVAIKENKLKVQIKRLKEQNLTTGSSDYVKLKEELGELKNRYDGLLTVNVKLNEEIADLKR